MRLYTLVALLGTGLASGVGEIGKTKETQAKDVAVAPYSTHIASMLLASVAISMNVNTKTNIQGHIQTVALSSDVTCTLRSSENRGNN
jgi:hypothetical protein